MAIMPYRPSCQLHHPPLDGPMQNQLLCRLWPLWYNSHDGYVLGRGGGGGLMGYPCSAGSAFEKEPWRIKNPLSHRRMSSNVANSMTWCRAGAIGVALP